MVQRHHGKTGLGVALSKKINGEVISADSMQIYKELNIGTAKVQENEKHGIAHHLIDICSVRDKYSVAEFKKMCYDKIIDIKKRNKIPVIVGGTGLYISSVVNNMSFDEEMINQEYRDYLYALANLKSNQYVYELLKNIDEKSAKEIHPNNLKRVIRAIEIAKNSNKLKSEHIKEEKERIKNEQSEYDFLVFYIDFDRETLYERINKRVDIMIKEGLLDEAKEVYNMKLSSDCTCMQSIGYKEFFPYFEGKLSLEAAIEKLKKDTRKYAKRQETWFKNKLDIIKIDGNLSNTQKVKYIISYLIKS